LRVSLIKRLGGVLTVFALSVSTLVSQSGSSGEPKLRPEMLVTTDWLAGHLHDPDLVLLSVSSSAEFYKNGHIPGARHIALGTIAVTRDGIPNELPQAETLQQVFAAAGVNDTSRVVLYGERYNLMAARAFFTLDYLGVKARVALLDGGLDKWVAEHRPLSQEAQAVRRGHLTITPRPELLADTAAMRKLIERKAGEATIVDARPTKEFTGEQLSEDVNTAGHIPGARGLYWIDMLVSRENPVLRPVAELRRIYTALDAQADRPLVTYCRTGMQSSFDYFVARYLGYEPSMYDGSFYEWSQQGLPAEISTKK